jgi:arginyl-tRNA synthetase
MYRAFEVLLEAALDAAIANGRLAVGDRPACRLESPEHPAFGDATTRVALGLARRLGRPAPDVARTLVAHVDDPRGWIERVEAAGPGFVNVRASLAFWRTSLASTLWDPPAAASPPPHGRALVLRVPADDAARDARAAVVAHGLGGLLGAAGHAVEHRVAPIASLAGGAGTLDRIVMVHGTDDATAVRQAKDGFARAGGQAGQVIGVGVGSLVVRRRGRPLAADEAAALLATPAARFAVAAEPCRTPVVLDVERLAADRIDNPWVPVRYALARIARLGAAVPGAHATLDPLGEPDRECLQAVGSHADVVEVAARRAELALLVAHARRLAAAFHRRYNRGAFAAADPSVARARRALASGVGRILETTLAVLDAPGVEGA